MPLLLVVDITVTFSQYINRVSTEYTYAMMESMVKFVVSAFLGLLAALQNRAGDQACHANLTDDSSDTSGSAASTRHNRTGDQACHAHQYSVEELCQLEARYKKLAMQYIESTAQMGEILCAKDEKRLLECRAHCDRATKELQQRPKDVSTMTREDIAKVEAWIKRLEERAQE
mmetsp:Transcript_24533/g.53152  ORF Transcript_24533/g.53152 Transcript_24533/m.53152 type:complete len:173 (-) Transcript_24533:136-654(-)